MYHYTECGLDNVWLENGYSVKQTPYGKAVSVTNVDELFSVLAMQLVKKPARLTGKELRFLRVQMGLSQAAFAKIQGVTEQNVSLWERHGKVPKANDTLARLCFMAHASGDATLRSALEQIMNVERLIHQRIVATSSRRGWKSKLETKHSDESIALAA